MPKPPTDELHTHSNYQKIKAAQNSVDRIPNELVRAALALSRLGP
jgi:hypothetical protein